MTVTRIAPASPLTRAIDVLETFDQASPSLIDDRALQQRVDRKYLLTPDLCACILAQLWSHYQVLRTAGAVAARYESIYFDTDERQFYNDHRRGRLPRHKVRIRRHVDRELAFLEIKRKEKSGRTLKARLGVPFDQTDLGRVEREFVEAHAPIDAASLRPRVTIWFLRTTLVGAWLNERLTLDWDVQFRAGGASGGVPGVAVVELKQPNYSQRSAAVETFRAMRVREHGVSKYCLATSRLTAVRGKYVQAHLQVAGEAVTMRELLANIPVGIGDGLAALISRLVLNLVFTGIVVRLVYYRIYRKRDYAFTYLLLNVVTFSLTYLLSRVPIELGFALGLFAVFGILRYRTEAIAVRDLTYLFVVIGIALLNALGSGGVSTAELVVVNAIITVMVWSLEIMRFSGREQSRQVLYDRLDLLGPGDWAELLSDLRRRTHLPVERYEIGNVDLLRDCADITIYYRSEPKGLSMDSASRAGSVVAGPAAVNRPQR